MPVFASELARSEVTVPLSSFIQPFCAHYFSGRIERPHYRQRDYSFPGLPHLIPLTRAFLDTCAAAYSHEYRYLFTLLGSELAGNAIRHTRSSLPGGSYDLQVRRTTHGLHLTCRDRGNLIPADFGPLAPDSEGLNPESESGRGLAMLDALATKWGDNGVPEARHVWFFLAADLNDNLWASL